MKVPFKLPDSSVIQKKNYYSPQAKQIFNNYPAKSRGISPDT